MAVNDTLTINCLLAAEFNFGLQRSNLCHAMQELAGDQTTIHELGDDLTSAPGSGYLVIAESFDTTEQYLSESQLQRTFLLDGANGPGLNRCLEQHSMPGGFTSEEWFKVRSLGGAHYPTLRREVAESVGFERIDRPASEHYAQYEVGLGLAELLVRYLGAYHQWRGAS